MRYLGGKSRIAKKIAAVMLESADPSVHTTYLEPFVGGGAVFAEMAPHFPNSTAADAHEDLILMWQAVKDGRVPPATITEAEYQELKNAEPSARRAFAGFGCSFGGKWFGGYARHADRSFAAETARNITGMAKAFAGAEILHSDYRDFSPGRGTVVYCDPPYAGTTAYTGVSSFSSVAFWGKMTEWTEDGALVFVSEYAAPRDWYPVWEGTVRSQVDMASAKPVVERLWRCVSS